MRHPLHNRRYLAKICLLAGMLLSGGLRSPAAAQDLDCAPALRRAATAALPSTGRLHALVLFARFQDEAGSDTAPAFAEDLFDPAIAGSLTHFFAEMSSGQFALTGDVLPRVYTSLSPTQRYLSGTAEGRGDFGRFTREIIDAADAQVDFGAYDNDGPDGLPNSGDDDGFVDLLLLVTQSTPSGFIVGDADGVAQLGLETSYRTDDAAVVGGRGISVRGDSGTPGGTLQRGLNFADAVGIIAHEMGHILGLPDLYDRVSDRGGVVEPADHSAGIGYWGLMGHGARGWDDRGGPTPFSSWSRMQLGWLGVGNEQLVVVTESIDDAFLGDVNVGGVVYQLPLPDNEYLLVEHRSATGSWYDRGLPAEGVLIWRIDPDRPNNDDEYDKVVDLVCADGLFLDAGFPLGMLAGFDLGQDNLDFYASDASFAADNGGNLGDATDVFDGVRFSEYTPLSNPAINGISISNIRPAGAGFSADLVVADKRRAGLLTGRQTWRDTMHILGDVTIAAGASVDIAPRTVIQVYADGRHGGTDPERVEIIVEGTMLSQGTSWFGSASASPAAGDWIGLSASASGQLALGAATIDHARDAIRARGSTRGLSLRGVTVRTASGSGIDLTDISGRVELLRVTVEGVGGDAVTIDGGDFVRVQDLRATGNGGHGFTRADGGVALSDSELSGNGLAVDGYDLWLREGASGTVSTTRLAGTGEGARLELTGALILEQNEWTGYRVALRTRSANPSVRGNVFTSVDTVLSTQGFRVPAVLQLNVVNAPQTLVANESPQMVDAARNWWGTTEGETIEAGMSGPVNWDPPLNFDPRLPVGFALEQNYPNPFNGSTVIDFTVSLLDISLTTGERMHLDVRTIAGGLVRRVYSQSAAPGIYRVVWDGRDEDGRQAASGAYFYELSVGPIRLLRSLTVLR